MSETAKTRKLYNPNDYLTFFLDNPKNQETFELENCENDIFVKKCKDSSYDEHRFTTNVKLRRRRKPKINVATKENFPPQIQSKNKVSSASVKRSPLVTLTKMLPENYPLKLMNVSPLEGVETKLWQECDDGNVHGAHPNGSLKNLNLVKTFPLQSKRNSIEMIKIRLECDNTVQNRVSKTQKAAKISCNPFGKLVSSTNDCNTISTVAVIHI